MDQSKVIEFFTEGCNRHGTTDWAAAYYTDDLQQHGSFLQLSTVGDFNNSTVLDVGCGQGKFYRFLKQNKIQCDYEGIDITPKMIEFAKQKNPNAKFTCSDFLDASLTKTYDWVVSAGAWNVKVEDQMALIGKAIYKMYKQCKKGVAFTLLSSYGYEQAKEFDALFCYEPGAILTYCLSLTPAVTINHSSLPAEFVVFMYKLDHLDQQQHH
jgi:SAM-dependent methyltransferase